MIINIKQTNPTYQKYSSKESNFRMPHLLLQQIHPQFYFSPLKFSSSLQSSPFPSQFQASRPCFYSPSSVNLLPPPPVMRGATIRCMANSRRVKMVAKQIQRELSDMLLTDKVLQFAILPEASLGADKYLSSLTTITDVEVSADLQVLRDCLNWRAGFCLLFAVLAELGFLFSFVLCCHEIGIEAKG